VLIYSFSINRDNFQIGDLRRQLELNSGLADDVGSDEQLTQRSGVRLAEEKQKEKLKQMDLKRREAQEVCAEITTILMISGPTN
jgi:hypothetical protein